MFTLNLTSPLWHHSANLYVRGYAFLPDGRLLHDDTLASYMDVADEDEWTARLKSLNGIYAIIRNAEDFAAAAIDISRLFPIFFRHDAETLLVSDDPYTLIRKGDKESQLGVAQYLASGNTFDGYTLIDGIHQLRPAEYITANGHHASTFSLCVPRADIHASSPDDFTTCLDHVFSRLIQSLDGRQVVIPLSGGYDSRLIACMLHKHGYKNVICFTAGVPNNVEVQISPKIAETLGFKFYEIDTTDPDLATLITTSNPDFVRYYKHLGGLTNFLWLFEYAAISRLRQLGVIEPNAIFVPGHTANTIAGSELTTACLKCNSSLSYMTSAAILDKFEYGHANVADCVRNYLANHLTSEIAPWTAYQDFVVRNDEVQNINNSARVYEFFGYEVRLPYYDHEFLNFFAHLPLEYLTQCRFYVDYVNNKAFKPMGVYFPRTSLTPRQYKIAKLRKRIKPFIPSFLLNLKAPITDHVGEFPLSVNLRHDLDNVYGAKTYRRSNQLLRDWYLLTLRQLLKEPI